MSIIKQIKEHFGAHYASELATMLNESEIKPLRKGTWTNELVKAVVHGKTIHHEAQTFLLTKALEQKKAKEQAERETQQDLINQLSA